MHSCPFQPLPHKGIGVSGNCAHCFTGEGPFCLFRGCRGARLQLGVGFERVFWPHPLVALAPGSICSSLICTPIDNVAPNDCHFYFDILYLLARTGEEIIREQGEIGQFPSLDGTLLLLLELGVSASPGVADKSLSGRDALRSRSVHDIVNGQ